MVRGIVFLLFSISAFAQLPFKQLVVFGDSLSDNGNFYAGTSLLGVPTPAPPQYATGEFTDGVNSVPSTTSPLGLWIEQLAPKLNVAVPQPFAKGGLNYATASAHTGSNPAFPGALAVPYSTDQVNEFLKATPAPPADYLYVFWCGAEDILNGGSPSVAAANVQANIDTLAKAGAKYFLWADMPPLGEVPENVNTANRAALDSASAAYNTAWAAAIAQLAAAHPGITIAPYDAYSGFLDVIQNGAFYGFVNVTSAAQGQASVNPNTYLFWDMLHPTTAADAFIADGAYAGIGAAFEGIPAATSVVNAFGNSPVIAPNTWVAVRGAALSAAGDTRMWQDSDFVNGQMPAMLDGVSVTINGESAYLYDISPAQLNILTPPDLAPGTAQVAIKVKDQSSQTFPVQSQALSPSFFVFDGTHVVAQHLDYTDVGPATLYPGMTTPAKPGEEVVLYANGFGPTSEPVISGSVTQGGMLPALPVVMIGGVQAQVLYAGLAGVGEFQFNVIVPAATPNGDIPLTATFAGLTTQSGVVIAVEHVITVQP